MKKIVLALALVLAFSSLALAADIKFSGFTQLSLTKEGDNDPTYGNKYRLQLDGTLDENSGFQIRLENGTIKDTITPDDPATTAVDETVTADVAVGALLKRANYWVNIPNVGKVVAGLQYMNYSALDWNTSYLNLTKPAVSFSPALPAGKAIAFVVPDNDPDKTMFGAEGSVDVAGATIYGGATKVSSEDDAALAVGASYPVIADQLIVYGEYNKKGDLDENDEKYVGAEFKAAGFDVYGEYAVDSKLFALDVYKTIANVEFNVGYEKPDEGDSTISVATTLYF